MKLINCLIKKNTSCVPIWFMRQAGRYLPEFREIRKNNPNFVKLCLNSELSSQITLQPLERFDLDAAIIFSDILMVPYGFGQKVDFKKDLGPVLSDLDLGSFLKFNEKDFTLKLNPIYEAIKKTRKKLDKNKPLISFVGSPWTLAVYMMGIKKEKILNLELINQRESEINLILEKLNIFLCAHIKNQIKAGANIIQIFDSWAGLIPQSKLSNYCYEPNKKLVDFCKKNNIPVICFPKGIKKNYFDFLQFVKPDGLNIDYDLDPEWVRKNLNGVCIQGGLNPEILLKGEKEIIKEADKYLKIFANYPYIFNLGHGLLPQTKPDSVGKLVKFVRNYK